MKTPYLKFLIIITILISVTFTYSQIDSSQLNNNMPHLKQDKNIISLSWDQVIDISLKDNLELKLKALDYDAQDLEEWKAITTFIPTISYTGLAMRNLELPVFIFMGQRFIVGTNYSFQHSVDLNLPLFTGGSRWFNLSAQKSLRKSLSEELKGKEEEIVLSALQTYYGVMLSTELMKTSEEAVEVAKGNLQQVHQFYDAGTATELDFQRAKAQYSFMQPQLESASSNMHLSYQRLKTLLNIPLSDSLVISDSLIIRSLLNEYGSYSLDELKNIAGEKRKDIKALSHKLDATKDGERTVLAQFSPVVSFSANLSYQAQLDQAKVSWNDYIRSKSIALSVYWPIFDGGKTIVDYQIAQIHTDQMNLLVKQTNNFAALDVEEKYFDHQKAIKILVSLKDAMEQSKESLRISELMYNEGMVTQIEVLNSLLLYTQSKTEYLQGIFNYNVSQLSLLQSVGMLDSIWNGNR